MISYEEALVYITENVHELGTESIDFKHSVHRVLSEEIFSDIDMPPFNKSVMDGYACRRKDLKNVLDVVEVIPAGVWPKKIIGKNQCAKIMTGAPLPKGADTVVMVEYTKKVTENQVFFTKECTKSNISLTGEDIKTGEVVLKKGTLIKEKHIPILASVGAVSIKVYKQPHIAIISTGNELVEPDVKPVLSQIRNSNAYQMVAQTQAMNLTVSYFGIAKDTIDSMLTMLNKAFETAEVVIMSGAVSMGDYDFVPLVLKKAGISIHFHGIAIKPGKRTIFGTKKNKWFVGIPGNPVSAFVQFDVFIKPLISGIMGCHYYPKMYKLPLEEDFKRKNALRKAFEPVKITVNGTVVPVEYHGSAHINALSCADGLMIVEQGITKLKKGDFVDVRPI